MIFVFGSNLAGRHGRGAAATAKRLYGAKTGMGVGYTGNSYAIPTKDEKIKTLPLSRIKRFVEEFIDYATSNPDKEFYVTKIGCGLAGYTEDSIKPMFKNAPSNCILPKGWRD